MSGVALLPAATLSCLSECFYEVDEYAGSRVQGRSPVPKHAVLEPRRGTLDLSHLSQVSRQLNMATTSGATEKSSDALSRLRIQRTETRGKTSWFGSFLKWVFVLVLLLALAGGGLVAASRFGLISGSENWLQVPEAIQSRPEVRLASVTVETGRSADATVVATGYLESRRQARIGARAPGRIEVVNVEEGSRVEAGQVLAVLEHADLDASLAAVKQMRPAPRPHWPNRKSSFSEHNGTSSVQRKC